MSEPFVETRAASDRAAIEARVASIWRRVLGADEITRDADFFGLGGTSLGAMQVVAECNVAFGTTLPWPLFLREPTVAGLATAIGRAKR